MSGRKFQGSDEIKRSPRILQQFKKFLNLISEIRFHSNMILSHFFQIL